VLKNGQHLLELINQVLDLARIEAGQTNISLESVDLSPVISECLDLARPLVGQSRIELDFLPVAEALPPARADKSVLRQVLLNLISNAIKYNRDGGRVAISAERTSENKVRVTVADTGPGIPREKQAQIFEPFNRLGLEGSTTDGAGIGLTISKQLVEQMEGRIGFESEIGRGSRFWIELPVAYLQKRRY
jgi:signal transduction histidine kinase